MSHTQNTKINKIHEAWARAGQVLLFVLTVEVHGQNFTGGWSIICEDILIIKFDGIMSGSIRDRKRASRVGNQCLVLGVCLQTSNILVRCLAL